MPTDWLNMPELPRDIQFPSTRRRVGVGVLYVFTLSCSLNLWSLFQRTIVRLLLAVLVWPFSTTRWAIAYLPPFEGTPGASGEVRARCWTPRAAAAVRVLLCAQDRLHGLAGAARVAAAGRRAPRHLCSPCAPRPQRKAETVGSPGIQNRHG